MRRLAALALAAVAYVLAAWLVAPGFFDGFAPAEPYHWLSPPPELRSGNRPPTSGRATIPVQNGVAQAGHLYTTDQQASVTFPSQSFEVPPDGSPITLEIKPAATYPDLGGVVAAGNVYTIIVSTRIISPVVVTLRYGSQQSGPPSDIFAAESSTARWRPLGSINSAVPYTVSASTRTLGYFVVGFPPASQPASTPAAGAGGPPVALAVALGAAAIVLLAAIPVIAMRRRGAAAEPPGAKAPPEAPRNLGGARRSGRRRGRR